MLSGEFKQLFAEADVDLTYLASILVNLLQFINGFAVSTLGVAAAFACENKCETPDYRNDADDVFPEVVPGDNAARGKQQQDADAKSGKGTALVFAAEKCGKTGDYDKDGPPAFIADAD